MRYFLVVIFSFIFLYANESIENTTQELNETYTYYEDSERALTIKQLFTDEKQFTSRFEPFDPHYKSFGLTKSRYWIKAVLSNTTISPLHRLLKFEYPLLDHVRMYNIDDAGSILHVSSGDSIPVQEHHMKNELIIFPVTLDPLSTKTLYFSIDSQSSMDLRLETLSVEDYYETRLEKQLIYSFIYGGSLVMILYNFFLFLSIRERSYFYYVLFQIFNLLTLTSLSGIAFFYFWPENPDINNYTPFLIVVSNGFAIMFTRMFLDTSANMPKVDRLLQVLLAIIFVVMLLTLIFDYHVGIVSSVVVIFMTTSSLVIVGFMAFFKKVRASKFYLMAWIFLLIGATLTGFKNIGILPITPLTTWGVQLGAFFELILLSFGLADRINSMRKEQQRLERDSAEKAYALTNVLEQSKIKLEHTVIERTQELRSANLQLEENVSAKESLLKELHHRVKNNLQVSIAMMSLQKKRAQSEETKTVIDDANKRLQSMAIVHEMLYTRDTLSSVNMQEYLQKLSQRLCIGFSDQHVDIEYKLDEIHLDLDRAISIGLICNEIITNAFKHAFDNTIQDKKLYILLKQMDKSIVFGIKDNGKGFDGVYEHKGHFGLLLIEDLVAKLPDAHFTFKVWHGTYFRMEFLR